MVRAHEEAQRRGLHLIAGSELRLSLPAVEGSVLHARLMQLTQTRDSHAGLVHWQHEGDGGQAVARLVAGQSLGTTPRCASWHAGVGTFGRMMPGALPDRMRKSLCR